MPAAAHAAAPNQRAPRPRVGEAMDGCHIAPRRGNPIHAVPGVRAPIEPRPLPIKPSAVTLETLEPLGEISLAPPPRTEHQREKGGSGEEEGKRRRTPCQRRGGGCPPPDFTNPAPERRCRRPGAALHGLASPQHRHPAALPIFFSEPSSRPQLRSALAPPCCRPDADEPSIVQP
jgi:hypothetical protein